MIQGVFYARFFPQEGPQIVAQSPPGCITSIDHSTHHSSSTPNPSSHSPSPPLPSNPPSHASSRPPLVDFEILQEYIIPRQAFCNRYVTLTSPDGKYAILGYPVLIPNAKYMRNEFIFNFGLIVEAEVDQMPYENVVRRLASTFAEMEKQNEYLSSREEQKTLVGGREDKVAGQEGRRSIEGLLEIIKEDLNNYGECMIPVDEANTINMKLFPHHPNPPPVRGWHVPVSKTKFADVVDSTWDLTLQRVIQHIDGVSDVRRIAHNASVSLDLAITALRHLLYYDTILMLDMFFFSNCYAPRPGIHDFVRNVDGMLDECAGYVSHGSARLSNFHLIRLMTTFAPGKSVMEWLYVQKEAGLDVLHYIDVRRLVQFGLIKGCLYRVQKYVVSKQYIASLASGQSRPLPDGGDPLQQYTDGCHHFDQIITEQNLTDEEVVDKLKSLPVPKSDLTVFYR